MKIIASTSSLICLTISMNSYAIYPDHDPCASFEPDHDKPVCEMIKQLERLNSKVDDTNEKLSDIESKLNEIESKLDTNNK